MTHALLIACFALHASFAWARFAVFRIDGPTPRGVRLIEFTGTASALLGLAVLALQAPRGAPWPLLALFVAAASGALFMWSLHGVRPRQLTAAFSPDRPTELLTHGAFGFCRNPFYLSYLLAHAVPLVATHSWWALASLLTMVAIYRRAALLEERKFLESALVMAYRRYCRRTGRFLPRLWPASLPRRAGTKWEGR